MRKTRPANSPKLTTVLGLLPGLDVAELHKVVIRSNALRKLQGAQIVDSTYVSEAEASDDWILDGIYYALRENDLLHLMMPRSALAQTPAYQHYKRYAPAIRSNLEAQLAPLSPPETIHIGNLFGELFLTYVLEKADDVSLQALLWRIQRYSAAIEQAFPGYMASGLLTMILKSRRAEVRG